jgi:tetratricopeptide (TPR) repeat protein
MAITLPFLLFIYEYFSGRFTKKTIPLLLPFVVVSVIFSIVAYFSILTYTGDRTGQLNYNAFEKVYLFITETGYYFSKVFFPVNPSLFHFFPAKSALYHPDLLIPFFIGLGILGLLFFYRKNRIISGAFVAWLGMLLPVLQIIPNTHSYVSERYFYLTIIFPVIILLEISRSRISDNRMRQVALIVLFIFCIFTYRQSKNWKNTETLFTYELSIDPRNPMANNNLGYYYNGRNQFEKARPMLAEAMRADSLNGQYYSNYGWCLAGLGKIDSSIIYFEKAIHLKRDLFEAHNNLGICYFRTNRKEDAFREFKTAEQLKADHPEVLYNLGAYYLQDKNSDLAKTYLSRASILGHQGAANLLRKYNL